MIERQIELRLCSVSFMVSALELHRLYVRPYAKLYGCPAAIALACLPQLLLDGFL